MKIRAFFRRWHRFLAMLFLLPILITSVTGFFLLYRKEFSFMKPQWQKVKPLKISDFSPPKAIENKISTLGLSKKISHIRFYPKNGITSLRLKDDQEIILKGDTLEVLGKGTRYDSFFIRLHEGSYWGAAMRKFLFGPMSIVLVFLLISGGVLGFYFYKNKRYKLKSRK